MRQPCTQPKAATAGSWYNRMAYPLSSNSSSSNNSRQQMIPVHVAHSLCCPAAVPPTCRVLPLRVCVAVVAVLAAANIDICVCGLARPRAVPPTCRVLPLRVCVRLHSGWTSLHNSGSWAMRLTSRWGEHCWTRACDYICAGLLPAQACCLHIIGSCFFVNEPPVAQWVEPQFSNCEAWVRTPAGPPRGGETPVRQN